jgi:hypothetical protein
MFVGKRLDTTTWNADGVLAVLSMMHNGHNFDAESTIIETGDLIEKSNHIMKF